MPTARKAPARKAPAKKAAAAVKAPAKTTAKATASKATAAKKAAPASKKATTEVAIDPQGVILSSEDLVSFDVQGITKVFIVTAASESDAPTDATHRVWEVPAGTRSLKNANIQLMAENATIPEALDIVTTGLKADIEASA